MAEGTRGQSATRSGIGAPSTTSSQPRRRWLKGAADRVPTTWFAGIGIGLFLLATAAFGGLAAAPPTPLPTLAAGEQFIGAQIEMSPLEAFIVDEQQGTGFYPEDGQRIVVLLLDATNLDPTPRLSADSGAPASVRMVALGDVEPAVYRWDDKTYLGNLQPGVPAPLALSWIVDADAFSDGDELVFTLPDATRYVGASVVSGVYWSDERVGALATLALTDRGATVAGENE